MRYAPFLEVVEQAAGISRDTAEQAIRATLATLAERITRGEAEDIAAHLPPELRPLLTNTPEPAEAFSYDEFMRRVAEREGVTPENAAGHARAVFVALGVAVAPGELRDMAAQLPKDFYPLLDAAGVGRSRAMAQAPDDVVGRVARIAGMDREAARRATEAVLETLAVRISAGEVEDLEAELPPELLPALERGLRVSRSAKVMSADEFIAEVADREGTDIDVTEDHVRAVFAALREVVTGKEFSDMAAQLSADYGRLLVAAT
jgi:uncharacterized protein (DUF2267 family)